MKTYYFFLGLIILVCIPLSAQDNKNDFNPNKLVQEMTSSPEVSNLGAYGNFNATPYNGTVDISIPLHELDFDGIRIPLILSYDSRGVRASQDAGWVGLNWNLSSYFAISRTINGSDDLDDYSSRGYIYNNYNVQTPEGVAPYMDYDDIVDVHASFGDGTGSNNIPIDMEADLFEVSLFGKNYKFHLRKKKYGVNTIIADVLNNNNVKINFDLTDLSFNIVDDQGFQYHFGSKEINTSFSSIPTSSSTVAAKPSDESFALQSIFEDLTKANESVITNWLLDSIVSPNSRVLHFDYRAGMHFSFPDYSQYVEIQDNSFAQDDYGVPILSETYHATTTVIENQYLDKIYGDFGEIDFELTGRSDLFNAQALAGLVGPNTFSRFVTSQSEIYIDRSIQQTKPYLKLSAIVVKDFEENEVKNIGFGYSYFNQDKVNFADKERYLRLKLDYVDVNEKKYNFEYILPNSLPIKNTNDIDFWGFYNGANNLKRIPSIGRFVTQSYAGEGGEEGNHVFMEYNGANRGSNFGYGKIGLLNKVIYPTGGHTDFRYEPHQARVEVTQPYSISSYRPDGNIKWTSLVDEEKYRFTYQYLKKAKDPNYLLYDHIREPTDEEDLVEVAVYNNQEFTVTQPTLLKVNSTLKCHTGCSNTYFSNQPLRVVSNINSGKEEVLFTYGSAPSQSGGATNTIAKELILAPGDYKIITKPLPYDPACSGPNPSSNCTTPAIQVVDEDYKIYVPKNNGDIDLSKYYETFEIGGARINSISNYDEKGALSTKKMFEYDRTNALGNTETSGMLMDELIYFTKPYGFTTFDPRNWGASSPLKLQSTNALRTIPSAKGSHIGYSYVKEKIVDGNGNSNGWTEKEFINLSNRYHKMSWCRPIYNTNGISGHYPQDVCTTNTYIAGIMPKNSFGYINGSMNTERVFNGVGKMLRENLYDYIGLTGKFDNLYSAKFMPVYYPDISTVGDPNHPFGSDHTTYYLYNTPVYNTMESVVKKITSKEFLDYTVTSDKTNYYDRDTHYLTQTLSKLENNEERLSKIYYPNDDEVDDLPFMQELRDKNRIATPIKTETFQNTRLLGAQVTKYAQNKSTQFVTLPISVESVKGIPSTSNPYKSKIRYEEYGPNGTLRQVRLENGTPISYIWGYNNMYIVAKVENATYDIIESLPEFGENFDLGFSSLSDNQEITLRTHSSMKDAMITTYTYMPLVGIKTITDPRVDKLTYIYDEFNRVKEVRDAKNNLIKDYDYKFVTIQHN